MALAGRPKGGGYRKKETPQLFLSLCKQGYTPLQIASHIGVTLEQLKKYPKTIPGFAKTWQIGKELAQAYHENRLDKMIRRESYELAGDGNDPTHFCTKTYSSTEVNAQMYILRVRFKEDWSEKQEAQKVAVTHTHVTDSLSLDEIRDSIKKVAAKPTSRKLLKEMKISVGDLSNYVSDESDGVH